MATGMGGKSKNNSSGLGGMAQSFLGGGSSSGHNNSSGGSSGLGGMAQSFLGGGSSNNKDPLVGSAVLQANSSAEATTNNMLVTTAMGRQAVQADLQAWPAHSSVAAAATTNSTRAATSMGLLVDLVV